MTRHELILSPAMGTAVGGWRVGRGSWAWRELWPVQGSLKDPGTAPVPKAGENRAAVPSPIIGTAEHTSWRPGDLQPLHCRGDVAAGAGALDSGWGAPRRGDKMRRAGTEGLTRRGEP